jgi:hypothetical protein
MAFTVGGKNPDRRKLPRHARHLIRHMLGRVGYHRAAVLDTQARSLEHEVGRSAKSRHPGESPHGPGHRVRLGPDTRNLLRKLLASKDRRVQIALTREIRQQVAARIRAHIRRSNALRMIREKTRKAAIRTWGWARTRPAAARRAWGWARTRPAAVRDARASRVRQVRVVGSRPRTRQAPARAPQRALPGSRTARSRRRRRVIRPRTRA